MVGRRWILRLESWILSAGWFGKVMSCMYIYYWIMLEHMHHRVAMTIFFAPCSNQITRSKSFTSTLESLACSVFLALHYPTQRKMRRVRSMLSLRIDIRGF